MYEKRASLGESDFTRLNHDHVHYYEFNTVLALALMVGTCILYLVVTNTFIVDFMTAYAELTI